MDKKEALAKLADIDRKADELKREAEALWKIVDAPEVDYSAWVGKWGFFSDDNPACSDSGCLGRLKSYNAGKDLPFYIGTRWRYFRPATPEELGFQGIEPDWSKAPDWAQWWALDADGRACWYGDIPDMKDWQWVSSAQKPDWTACPNWRETLRSRPK